MQSCSRLHRKKRHRTELVQQIYSLTTEVNKSLNRKNKYQVCILALIHPLYWYRPNTISLRLSSKAKCITQSLFIQYYHPATNCHLPFLVASTGNCSIASSKHFITKHARRPSLRYLICMLHTNTYTSKWHKWSINYIIGQADDWSGIKASNFHQHAEWKLN